MSRRQRVMGKDPPAPRYKRPMDTAVRLLSTRTIDDERPHPMTLATFQDRQGKRHAYPTRLRVDHTQQYPTLVSESEIQRLAMEQHIQRTMAGKVLEEARKLKMDMDPHFIDFLTSVERRSDDMLILLGECETLRQHAKQVLKG